MVQQGQVRGRPALSQPQVEHDFHCHNESHRNKKAEFIISLEDENLYYCKTCATQAASQGFTVSPITAHKIPQPLQASKQLPYYPQMQHNPKAHQLKQVMQDIITLEGEFKEAHPMAVEEHYQKQEGLLNGFYNQMAAAIERMRVEHLEDLKR